MNSELVSFRGTFQWWSYTVSHGQLLLRRTKNLDHKTRVDILFKDVVAAQLISVLNDVAIYEADLSVIPASARGGLDSPERNVFLIQTTKFQGYVVAGTVVWHEDEREYDDPSYFFEDS